MIDLINSGFVGIGGLLLWLNVRQLSRDRQVHGVHLFPNVFFVFWSGWNACFYLLVGQPISAVIGLNNLVANATWLWLAMRCRRLRAEAFIR